MIKRLCFFMHGECFFLVMQMLQKHSILSFENVMRALHLNVSFYLNNVFLGFADIRETLHSII